MLRQKNRMLPQCCGNVAENVAVTNLVFIYIYSTYIYKTQHLYIYIVKIYKFKYV
nr:MAG TPA: hypothetical protein [Caudoviricetes sp.]